MIRFARAINAPRTLFLASLMLIGPTAGAATLVDTGPSNNTFSITLSSFQSVAVEFSTTTAFTVTDVEGWIADGVGTLTASLYNDGGDVPGTSRLFSQSFTVGSTTGDFYGAHNLSWQLQASTSYWLVFEVLSGQTFSGAMPGASPNPLANAATNPGGFGWFGADTIRFGARIEGSPVPAPAAAWLLASAVVGLAGMGRRRRRIT